MEFRILGPLEVVEGDDLLPLGGAKQRTLLAVLLLHANEVVSTDRLIDALWGEEAADTAGHTLQVYVSQLRKALRGARDDGPEAVLVTRPPGYVLQIDHDEFDLNLFEERVAAGRRAIADGDPTQAAISFAEALNLWRGPPLAEFAYETFAQNEITKLAELRLSTMEDRIDADLALGRHADLVGELRALIAEHPLRERLRSQLILALYRSGRQAEALKTYQDARVALTEELGIDPTPALQRLERAILQQDPALDWHPATEAGAVAPAEPPQPREGATPLAAPHLERKFAAVLFADLVGSTAFAEQEDPEIVQSLVAPAFDRLADVIQRYGGSLEKFVGDALLAVFGVPVAHEDDPERAVRAALEVREVLAEINRGTREGGRPELAMRIGVEAGEVLVDLDRVGGSRDRMLTGDVVNTAARLQQAAEPGVIVAGPNAFASVKEVIDLREIEPLALKGKSVPLRAWEVIGAKTRRWGTRTPFGLEARLIGRDEELGLLVQTFHRVESERRPALVTVLGSAGVGKSRVALELLRYLETIPQSVTWRKGRCLAYGNVSYSALAEAVKAECGILEDDDPETVSDKTARAVQTLFGEPVLAPHMDALVGTGLEHSFSREDLFDAWRRFLERMADESPLVLVLEDIHWADDGLMDFVDHLADWARGAILVITLARPELLDRRPAWGGGKRNYSAVYLDPLTPEETEAMLVDLLSIRLPDPLMRTVVERSEGNPLFGEEIVRMLIDRGVIRATESAGFEVVGPAEQVEIPRSIHTLLAARLDSLPSEEKAILQDAGVVGRTFWLGATQRLSSLTAQEAKEVLGRLRVKEIIVPREPPTFSGEAEFAFRHVLIRDVAYESLPKSLRADKHVEVARWAEEQAGERRDEIAELLATHYTQAIRYLQELGTTNRNDLGRDAYRWARAAGQRALRLWQQREAARWFRSALEMSEGLGVLDEELALLWETYANACEGVEAYDEVARAFGTALAHHERLGDQNAAGRVEAWLAFVSFQSGQDDAVLQWTERALTRLEPLGESRDLALALTILGWYQRRSGRFDLAEPPLRRAVDIAARVGDTVTQARATVSLGKLLYQAGKGDEGLPLLDQGLETARGAGDLAVLLRALIDMAEANEEVTGDYLRAEALLREGLELARRAGHVEQIMWMEGILADILMDLGRLDEAEPHSRIALETAREIGETPFIGLSLPTAAMLRVLRMDLDEAEARLEELRPVIHRVHEAYIEAWEPLIAGLIAQGKDVDEEAAAILAEGANRVGHRMQVWGGENLLLETVRSLSRLGRPKEGLPFRDRLKVMSKRSVPAMAFLTWADGLTEPDHARARRTLVEAAGRFESLARQIELGRCLIDLADAERRLGEDHDPTLARARTILEACGATLFLREVDAGTALPEIARPRSSE